MSHTHEANHQRGEQDARCLSEGLGMCSGFYNDTILPCQEMGRPCLSAQAACGAQPFPSSQEEVPPPTQVCVSLQFRTLSDNQAPPPALPSSHHHLNMLTLFLCPNYNHSIHWPLTTCLLHSFPSWWSLWRNTCLHHLTSLSSHNLLIVCLLASPRGYYSPRGPKTEGKRHFFALVLFDL